MTLIIDDLYKKGAIIYENKEYNFYDYEISRNELSQCLRKKSICIVIDDKSIESTIAIISLLISNQNIILIDSLIIDKQISNLIKNFQCNYIIGSENSLSKLNIKNQIRTSYFSIIECKSSIKTDHPLDNQSILLLGTSGSSGVSKFVGITHENLIENCKSICNYLMNNEKTIAINNLPCSYSYGLSILNTTLFKGGKYIISKNNSFLRKEFWDDVNKYKITDFSGVPTTYKSLLKLDFIKLFPNSLKRVTQAGGKLDKKMQLKLLELSRKMNFDLFIMYGQTEATARLTFLNLTKEPNKIGTVGRVIKGVKLKSKDEYNNKDNRNLIFSGKNISLGYFTNYEDIINSVDKFKGVLITGDIGFLDEDNCITITGRESRFAKIDGHRIALDELEMKISEESENFAIVSNDEFLFIALPNSNSLSQKKLINIIAQDSTMHKSKIKVFDVQIPLTSNGKISYSELLKIMEKKI